MTVKPGPNLPSDGLARGKKPATAGEKRAIRKAVKFWRAQNVTIVKRPVLPTSVETTCVACGKAGVPRGLHLQEVIAFMYALAPRGTPRPPYYGACPEDEEIVQGIAENYKPTPEERYVLERCQQAGVDPMPLLFSKLKDVWGKRLKMALRDVKQIHGRLVGLAWAREKYPRAGWKAWAKMVGYPTGEAARKDNYRARSGGTKPKK